MLSTDTVKLCCLLLIDRTIDFGNDSRSLVFSFTCSLFVIALLFAFPAQGNGFKFSEPRGVKEMTWPKIPDLSTYTSSEVINNKNEMCDLDAPKQSSIKSMRKLEELEDELYETYKFTSNFQKSFTVPNHRPDPLTLALEQGCFSLNELAENYPHFIVGLSANEFVARVPISIRENAVLVLDSLELRLSTLDGAIISNSGEFFSIDSRVLGWNESENTPSHFVAKEHFRPYYVAWGGSRTWMLRSEFSYLGYPVKKSYGISFSQYGVNRKHYPEPTGWILESIFKQNYFGLYTYEAQDLVIVANEYVDNIVYGIDPHDFSHGLVIAYNEVRDTREKHGIIFSRSVVDSWVIGNFTHNNKGSGIVMDRQASRNYILNNVSQANGGDGISYYESPDNFSYGNTLQGNRRNGYYIRNSVNTRSVNDTIQANERLGVLVFSTPLIFDYRDYVLDPYEQRVSLSAYDMKLHNNKTGVLKAEGNIEQLEIVNPDIKTSVTPLFKGSINYLEDALLRKVFSEQKGFRIDQKQPIFTAE